MPAPRWRWLPHRTSAARLRGVPPGWVMADASPPTLVARTLAERVSPAVLPWRWRSRIKKAAWPRRLRPPAHWPQWKVRAVARKRPAPVRRTLVAQPTVVAAVAILQPVRAVIPQPAPAETPAPAVAATAAALAEIRAQAAEAVATRVAAEGLAGEATAAVLGGAAAETVAAAVAAAEAAAAEMGAVPAEEAAAAVAGATVAVRVAAPVAEAHPEKPTFQLKARGHFCQAEVTPDVAGYSHSHSGG